MSRVRASTERLREAYAEVRDDPQWTESCQLMDRGQMPSEMFQALAVRPDLLRALSAFGAPLYPGGLLERDLQERVVVAVSFENGCQYCTASHAGTMRRRGIDPEGALTPREQAALTYALAATRNPPQVPDILWGETRKHFSEEELVELTLLVGLTAMLNRFNDCLEVRYLGDYDRCPG
jgi:AhpD family alkylhydroperoxidase